jgi:hypothetical protein
MPAILGPSLDTDTREAFLFERDDEKLRGIAVEGFFTWRRNRTQPV